VGGGDRKPAAWSPTATPTSALTGGYRLAFLVAAALVVAPILISLTVLQPESECRPAYCEAA
jgi:hypothetical protein